MGSFNTFFSFSDLPRPYSRVIIFHVGFSFVYFVSPAQRLLLNCARCYRLCARYIRTYIYIYVIRVGSAYDLETAHCVSLVTSNLHLTLITSHREDVEAGLIAAVIAASEQTIKFTFLHGCIGENFKGEQLLRVAVGIGNGKRVK